jgi:hypothetical protein
MFGAGQASARRRGWLWPGATAAMTVVAAMLATTLVIRPAAPADPQVIFVRLPQPAATELPVAEAPSVPSAPALPYVALPQGRPDYLQLRRDVVRWGADVLPAAPPVSGVGQPLTPGNATDSILEHLNRPHSSLARTLSGDHS